MASKSLAYWWKNACVRSSDMSVRQLGITAQHVLERGHRKILKNAAHLRLRGVEIDVRLELPLAAHGQPRMTRVDLPRMDVEHHWSAFAEDLQRHAVNQPIRKQPQVTAAKEAHRTAQQIGDGDRNFQQRAVITDAMRFAPGLGNAAMTALRRKHRGIVLVARFGQRLEEPRSVPGGRKTWRPVAHYFNASDVFQQQARAANVLVELLAALFVDQAMPIAVRCHLMSPLGRLLHKVGEMLGHPSQEKAGHLNILFPEDLQQLGEVPRHAGGQTRPLVDGGHTRIVKNMEPVLNVNRENGVLHGGPQSELDI